MRTYNCMDCRKCNTDSDQFRMVKFGIIGFVVCNDCLAIPGRYNLEAL